jgi:hypothetical protein
MRMMRSLAQKQIDRWLMYGYLPYSAIETAVLRFQIALLYVDLKNLVASSTDAFHLFAKANGEKSHPR